MSGWCALDVELTLLTNFWVDPGSNLSGPHFLIRLDSIPGLLIAWIARPARYLNMGATWALRNKYKGTGL